MADFETFAQAAHLILMFGDFFSCSLSAVKTPEFSPCQQLDHVNVPVCVLVAGMQGKTR